MGKEVVLCDSRVEGVVVEDGDAGVGFVHENVFEDCCAREGEDSHSGEGEAVFCVAHFAVEGDDLLLLIGKVKKKSVC